MSQIKSIAAKLNKVPDKYPKAWRSYVVIIGGIDALLILWVAFAASIGVYFPLRAAILIGVSLLLALALAIWLSRKGNWRKIWGSG